MNKYDYPEYPIRIYDAQGAMIDCAGNVESVESVLFGDLSVHDGEPRTIYAPDDLIPRLEHLAAINADCWGIPKDVVAPAAQEPEPAGDEAQPGGMSP